MNATSIEAMKQVVATIEQHLAVIPGARRDASAQLQDKLKMESDSVYVEWSRSFSVGATLYVTLDGELQEHKDGTRVRFYAPRVEVSWASTGRTVGGAQASIALYQQVTNLGALIEEQLSELTIKEVR